MNSKLLNKALLLSLITIIYNVAEGVISTYFGAADQSLALFGFGVDSFVEVVSGAGILHMILRMKKLNEINIKERDKFEKTALIITGVSFYVLTVGITAGAILNVFSGSHPETTTAGVIISLISIATMYWLMKSKLDTGTKLNSPAIIADANCTRTCFYLSFILFFSSIIYQLTGIGFIDAFGSLGIAYYAFKEGKEALEKSKQKDAAISCDCH
ncbi:MAG: cation transporter [Ignavibacteriaceae bacterium]|nr:cation transporter [Ignavibacteriaceae bacterium]